MKLIIDIPEDYYEIIKHHVDNHQLDYRPFEIIANGTPLDDVKAEMHEKIKDLRELHDWGKIYGMEIALDIINEKIEGGMTDYKYDEYLEVMKQSLEIMNKLLDSFESQTERETTNETDN